jgi:hypothetical protein
MPPAAKTLFEKRVLDSQKLFIEMVSIVFFLCDPLCIFVAKIRRWIWEHAIG